MKNILFVMLLILAAASVNVAQSKNEKIKADLKKVMDEQVAAWNRGDIDGFMQGYWNSPEMTFVSGDNVTKGWQPTLERYKKNYNTRAKMGVLTFSEIEIEILSRDAAKVLGRWHVAHEPKDDQGRFTLIFRKLKDGWKIVHDHTS
jgi:beta-aspartyl-peptidase (threonine type)